MFSLFISWITFFTHDPAAIWTHTFLLNLSARQSSCIFETSLQYDPCMLFGLLIFIMSVKRCCVPLCNKSRDDNVILHLFPHPIKDAERFEIWKRTISGHLLSLDNQTIFKLRRVCHLHFERQYHTWGKRLSHHAVPTLDISWLRSPLQDVTNIAVLDTESSGQCYQL